MTRLGYQIPNFTYPGVGPAELFGAISQQARESLSDDQRTALTGRFIVGDPDTVGERLAADLALGVDGFTLNAPLNGNIPGRVALLGQTAFKVVG